MNVIVCQPHDALPFHVLLGLHAAQGIDTDGLGKSGIRGKDNLSRLPRNQGVGALQHPPGPVNTAFNAVE
jgi:hypothetical protein